MREAPQGQDLLTIARTALLEKVVPLLPQDQRYNALMVANAMAIALRQWQMGEQWQREELARLHPLLGMAATEAAEASFATEASDATSALPAEPETLRKALLTANRALAQRIRHGDFDTPSQPVAELLEWMATQRVRESAPKALQGAR